MMLQMLLGASANTGADASLPATLSVEDTRGASSTASLTLNSAGTYSSSGNVAAPSGTWLLSGSGANFESRATVTSGTLTSGTANTWEALSSNRSWSKTDSSSVGASPLTVTFTLEIRRVSDSVVVTSSTVTLSAFYDLA